MYNKEYERWLEKATEDKDLLPELNSIKGNDEEIKNRFLLNLEFGTAGIRGVIGAGTFRMNIYTVRKATQGMADYIKNNKMQGKVAISYDSRIKSIEFSKAAASVLAANGIKVYIYKELMPTPALSFAVRYLKCDAGICVTASHNPAKYNGYKAYGSDGCQMTSEAANEIYKYIQETDIFEDVKTMSFDKALESGMVEYIGKNVYDGYYENVLNQRIRKDVFKNTNLKLVYTPLNGAGNIPVRHILNEIGVKDITIVKEQEMPDGNFPTCPYPNPEIYDALEEGLAILTKENADILVATDPDADRVGIAVKDKDGFKLISGNEVGVLLLDYICKSRIEKNTMPKKPIMVKSIVSTNLAEEVAESYGVETINVLTGFKYIGEQILYLEQKNETERFILGFEESYGYLVGSYVRDKDAVVASMLIVEMAAYYNSIGSSILEQLEKIYNKFGRYLSKVESREFEGLSGMDKMKAIMKNLRENPLQEIEGFKVVKIKDYQTQIELDTISRSTKKINLPVADVLTYNLDNGASFIVRPSGTEPKIKVYYFTKGKSLQDAEKIQLILEEYISKIIK